MAELNLLTESSEILRVALHEQHANLAAVHSASMRWVPEQNVELADVTSAHGAGAWVKASPWALGP